MRKISLAIVLLALFCGTAFAQKDMVKFPTPIPGVVADKAVGFIKEKALEFMIMRVYPTGRQDLIKQALDNLAKAGQIKQLLPGHKVLAYGSAIIGDATLLLVEAETAGDYGQTMWVLEDSIKLFSKEDPPPKLSPEDQKKVDEFLRDYEKMTGRKFDR